jgi:SAM-dependent methyltransferase
MKLLRLLAFTRIPGNLFSFGVRRVVRCSRGKPTLLQESKNDLFAYLREGREEAEARAALLHARYQLEPLSRLSTAALYRKNLYLLDLLEKATQALPLPFSGGRGVKALDVGSKDWYYLFALERWLRRHNRERGEPVKLTGVEVDGYLIDAHFYSCRDYAEAYREQTGNPEVRYTVGDFLAWRDGEQDIIFLFYPLLLRSHVLLWGLPLRYYAPKKILSKAAALTRPGGWLVVLCHTLAEHEILLEFCRAMGGYGLLREGKGGSNLSDFHGETDDCRFSVWERREEER